MPRCSRLHLAQIAIHEVGRAAALIDRVLAEGRLAGRPTTLALRIRRRVIPCDAAAAFLPFGSAAITVAVDADVGPARLLVFGFWDAALIDRVLAEGGFARGPSGTPVHVRRDLVAVDFAPPGLVLRPLFAARRAAVVVAVLHSQQDF